jgi:Ca2+-binding EF-hand superfamily protein
MSSAHEAANALPSNFDLGGLTNAFSNPAQAFRMLDKNNDGRVTNEDLQVLLQQFGVNGMAAKILAKYIFKQLDANGNGTIEPSDLTHANGILSSLLKMKQSGGAH